MTAAKNGMSAKTLQRTLGTCYRVAWAMLQRYRVAMVDPNRRLLSGNVEVDETLAGGVDQNGKRGHGTHKCIVVIAVAVKHPKGFGRVRMQHVSDVSGNSFVPFVPDVVEPGAMIHTDGWSGYNDLPEHGYTRKKIVLSGSGDPAHINMPGVHCIASLFKRWLLGTRQGSKDRLMLYICKHTWRNLLFGSTAALPEVVD